MHSMSMALWATSPSFLPPTEGTSAAASAHISVRPGFAGVCPTFLLLAMHV